MDELSLAICSSSRFRCKDVDGVELLLPDSIRSLLSGEKLLFVVERSPLTESLLVLERLERSLEVELKRSLVEVFVVERSLLESLLVLEEFRRSLLGAFVVERSLYLELS